MNNSLSKFPGQFVPQFFYNKEESNTSTNPYKNSCPIITQLPQILYCPELRIPLSNTKNIPTTTTTSTNYVWSAAHIYVIGNITCTLSKEMFKLDLLLPRQNRATNYARNAAHIYVTGNITCNQILWFDRNTIELFKSNCNNRQQLVTIEGY